MEIYIKQIANLLSMPSSPEAVIRPRADLPKLSLNAAVAATAAKFRLDSAPPMDNITFKCGVRCLIAAREPKQPLEPSTSN